MFCCSVLGFLPSTICSVPDQNLSNGNAESRRDQEGKDLPRWGFAALHPAVLCAKAREVLHHAPQLGSALLGI